MPSKTKKDYPAVTVDALIIENDTIIMVKRKYDPYKDYWALPGGFVELGETVEFACIREVKEETNLDVFFVSFHRVYSDPSRDPRGHMITVACFCRRRSFAQPLKGGDDAMEARKFTKREILKNKDVIAFDHFKIIQDSGFLDE